MSEVFKREVYEKKGVIKDVLSIKGKVDKASKKLVFGDVVAYDHATKKWAKYVKTTHNTGVFALGIVKEDVDVTSADETIAILIQGQVAKEDVRTVVSDDLLWGLLLKQGIYVG